VLLHFPKVQLATSIKTKKKGEGRRSREEREKGKDAPLARSEFVPRYSKKGEPRSSHKWESRGIKADTDNR
jgi:hypothetical protein